MIRLPLAFRALTVAAAGLSLAACVSLFPKTDPATTYRFGVTAPATPVGEPKGPMFGVLRAPTGFVRAAATDAILTTTGSETAYIGSARWVSPAPVLFDEALAKAFDVDPGPARLIARGEVAKSDFVLKLDVRAFEAQYVDGPKSAPDVVVSIRAVLTRNSDRALVGDQAFEARVKAGDNRVSAIVTAFDAAVSQVLRELLLWVNAGGAGPAGRG